MTILQELIKQKQDAKHQMFVHRPLRGYLGNQYDYWHNKWNSARKKIEQLSAKKRVKK